MSADEHRVASHLGVDANAYDVAIRRWIPGYEPMIGTIITMLEETLAAEPIVVDLGTGTGALAEAQTLFAQWAKEDRYYPLATELALLRDAGFVRPDCFWKRGAPTVFGGFK